MRKDVPKRVNYRTIGFFYSFNVELCGALFSHRWLDCSGDVMIKCSFSISRTLLELHVLFPLRKDEGSNRSLVAAPRLADNQQHGLPAMVPGIGVDAVHLSQVIAARFHEPGRVVVPFADVIGANLALPALRQ
jgi:hypothetical protein